MVDFKIGLEELVVGGMIFWVTREKHQCSRHKRESINAESLTVIKSSLTLILALRKCFNCLSINLRKFPRSRSMIVSAFGICLQLLYYIVVCLTTHSLSFL